MTFIDTADVYGDGRSERIVRASLFGQKLVSVIGEGTSVPAEADAVFEPRALNLYADSWLVERRPS